MKEISLVTAYRSTTSLVAFVVATTEGNFERPIKMVRGYNVLHVM
jgi:hypothetical protein